MAPRKRAREHTPTGHTLGGRQAGPDDSELDPSFLNMRSRLHYTPQSPRANRFFDFKSDNTRRDSAVSQISGISLPALRPSHSPHIVEQEAQVLEPSFDEMRHQKARKEKIQKRETHGRTYGKQPERPQSKSRQEPKPEQPKSSEQRQNLLGKFKSGFKFRLANLEARNQENGSPKRQMPATDHPDLHYQSAEIPAAKRAFEARTFPSAFRTKSLEAQLSEKQIEVQKLTHDLQNAVSKDEFLAAEAKRTEEISRLTATLQERDRELNKARNEIHEWEHKCRTAEENLHITTRDLSLQRKRGESAERERDDLGADKLDLENKVESLLHKLKRAEESNKTLREERSALHQRVSNETVSADVARKEYAAAQQERKHLLDTIEEFKEHLEDQKLKFEADIKKLSDERDDIKLDAIKAQNNLKAAQEQIEGFKASESTNREEIDRLKKAITDMSVEAAKVRNMLDSANSRIALLKQEIDEDARVVELRKELRVYENDKTRMEALLEDAKGRLKELEHRVSPEGVATEIRNADERTKRLGEKYTELDKMYSQLKIDFDRANEERQAMQTMIQTRNEELAQVRQARGSAEQVVRQQQELIAQIQNRVDQAEAQSRELQNQFEEARREYENVVARVNSLTEERLAESRQEAEANLSLQRTNLEAEANEFLAQKQQDYQDRLNAAEKKFSAAVENLRNEYDVTMAQQRHGFEELLSNEQQKCQQKLDSSELYWKNEAQKALDSALAEMKEKYDKAAEQKLQKAIEPYGERISKVIEALKVTLDYHTQKEARMISVLDDLIFIKDFSCRCLQQIEELDNDRLVSMGIPIESPRTFEGTATMVLAAVRMERLKSHPGRPRVSKKLKERYRSFQRDT